MTREPREIQRETRDGKGGRREEGIGERRSRRAGPVPPRSHVRPYNTRNTCNTDNTCNTCVTHYTPARQRPAGSPAAAGDDDRSYLRVLATPRDFLRDPWVPADD